MNQLQKVAVCVFAYNEERDISAALDAIGSCASEAELTVYVLMNGCTDNTESVVRSYRTTAYALRPVVISVGDKANAWNTYVHECAPADVAVHVFTDGDMLVRPGSIQGFLAAFSAEAAAQGCAGLPDSGRSRNAFREKLKNNREMAGNLYALRNDMVQRFRQQGVKLPIGMFGEDGLVTMLVKCDLDPLSQLVHERVTASEQGGFAYVPLSPWRLADWRIYRNRRRRYAMRRQQTHMLYPMLYREGIGAMPEHVIDMYRKRKSVLRMQWRGMDTWFDWQARQRILRDIAAADARALKAQARAHLYS